MNMSRSTSLPSASLDARAETEIPPPPRSYPARRAASRDGPRARSVRRPGGG